MWLQTHISAFGQTDIGGRTQNEDAFQIYDDMKALVSESNRGWLFCVADGMGGHRGGAHASKLVIDKMWDYYSRTRYLRDDDGIIPLLTTLIDEANAEICKVGKENNEYYGMGTTLTVAVLKDENMFYAHAGDSRLYHWRDGTLTQLTDDQTIAAELMRLGRITPQEARKHPQRHMLLNYLGREKEVKPQTGVLPLTDNDRILLCTDGVTEVLLDDELQSILAGEGDAQEICTALMDAVIARNPKDNATALVIKIKPVRS